LRPRAGGFPPAAVAFSRSGRRDSSSGSSSTRGTSTAVGSSRAEPSSSSSVPLPDTTTAADAELSEQGRVPVSAAEDTEGRGESATGRRAQGGAGGSGRLPLPFFDVESVGLKGRWEEMGGNFLLRPPDDQAPKALVHFLGGAFVGAAPHLTYNYLLSGLAEMGFLVVATPYPLGFDYLN
ncbi:unnamed protein product, partial [Ectocarpus sp. 4 AP-2014]